MYNSRIQNDVVGSTEGEESVGLEEQTGMKVNFDNMTQAQVKSVFFY
jgi:hypothetical protein